MTAISVDKLITRHQCAEVPGVLVIQSPLIKTIIIIVEARYLFSLTRTRRESIADSEEIAVPTCIWLLVRSRYGRWSKFIRKRHAGVSRYLRRVVPRVRAMKD
jgi:hypothetical protein